MPDTLGALTSQPATVTTTVDFVPNLVIPDNSSVGVADFRTVNTSIGDITSLSVRLTVSGGFNGDYYAYIVHGSGFAVLLNRSGKTDSSPLGYADGGLNVTFSSVAANGDIHTYQTITNPLGTALSGTWTPDARQTDPALVTDASPRSATFDSFMDQNARGTWSMFIADQSGGSLGTLTSWGLTIDGRVPEPSSATCLTLFSLLSLAKRRRS